MLIHKVPDTICMTSFQLILKEKKIVIFFLQQAVSYSIKQQKINPFV